MQECDKKWGKQWTFYKSGLSLWGWPGVMKNWIPPVWPFLTANDEDQEGLETTVLKSTGIANQSILQTSVAKHMSMTCVLRFRVICSEGHMRLAECVEQTDSGTGRTTAWAPQPHHTGPGNSEPRYCSESLWLRTNRKLIQSSNWQRSQTTEKTASPSQQAGHTTVGPLPPKVASKQSHPQPRLPPYLPRHRKLIVPSLLCPGRPPQSPLEMRHCPEATNWDVHKASVSRALCNQVGRKPMYICPSIILSLYNLLHHDRAPGTRNQRHSWKKNTQATWSTENNKQPTGRKLKCPKPQVPDQLENFPLKFREHFSKWYWKTRCGGGVHREPSLHISHYIKSGSNGSQTQI